jgi:hypothetical protein
VVGRDAADTASEKGDVMQVIGAGLPRTATLTQKIAFEMLGVGPCYHMVTVLSDLDRVGLWLEALAGDARWADVFAGFQSTVDWPGSFFYRELIDVYPDAKVVLSVRDPDRWAASMAATVLAANRRDNLMGLLSEARALVDPGWRAFNQMTATMVSGQEGLAGDVTHAADVLRRHIDEVKATVPSRRLLVWAAEDGWAPLCDFLGRPVPDAPLPNVNDSAMFEERLIEGALAALTRYSTERHQSPEEPESVLAD